MTTIVQALSAVMADVQAVGKSGRNVQQGYVFRGIDAVVNAVGPAFRKHGIIAVPVVEDATYATVEVGQKRTPMRECTVRVRYVFHGPEGDTIECVSIGEAMDSGDKATPKAMSVAYRVALLQALCIPTDEPDVDAQAYERAPVQSGSDRFWDPAEQEVLVTGWVVEIEAAVDDAELTDVSQRIFKARRELSPNSYDKLKIAGVARKAEFDRAKQATAPKQQTAVPA